MLYLGGVWPDRDLSVFAKAAKEISDCYTVIGGTACDILMSTYDRPFRATKDIDMIILLEDRFEDFAKVFWDYIKEGGYKCGWKSSDKVHFYRFTSPLSNEYPAQIELFSRKPDYHLIADQTIVPIYIAEDISSLSAIVLNDDFYMFMLEGRQTVDSISVLFPEHIIPFKMFAWLNLMKDKRNGKHVNSDDLKKHKYDVFRLLQIVRATARVKPNGEVKNAINTFISEIEKENIPFSDLGIDIFKRRSASEIKRYISLTHIS